MLYRGVVQNSGGLEKKHCKGAAITVHEVALFVGDKGTEVLAHHNVPGGTKLGV